MYSVSSFSPPPVKTPHFGALTAAWPVNGHRRQNIGHGLSVSVDAANRVSLIKGDESLTLTPKQAPILRVLYTAAREGMASMNANAITDNITRLTKRAERWIAPAEMRAFAEKINEFAGVEVIKIHTQQVGPQGGTTLYAFSFVLEPAASGR